MGAPSRPDHGFPRLVRRVGDGERGAGPRGRRRGRRRGGAAASAGAETDPPTGRRSPASAKRAAHGGAGAGGGRGPRRGMGVEGRGTSRRARGSRALRHGGRRRPARRRSVACSSRPRRSSSAPSRHGRPRRRRWRRPAERRTPLAYPWRPGTGGGAGDVALVFRECRLRPVPGDVESDAIRDRMAHHDGAAGLRRRHRGRGDPQPRRSRSRPALLCGAPPCSAPRPTRRWCRRRASGRRWPVAFSPGSSSPASTRPR